MSSEKKTPTNILHLSDLHFGTAEDAELWQSQISEDLKFNLSCEKLDVLIISGDIANFSVEAEYDAAAAFLRALQAEFSLEPDQIVMVPGNHDLNWKLSKKGYRLVYEEDCEGELKEGTYVRESDDVISVLDEEKYKARFRIFSEFYQGVKGEPYPLEYANQGMLHHFPAHNLLVLGLNSAWNLDHHFTKRAGIHAGALTRALDKIRKTPAYAACHKMAVWHHPMASKAEDRIADDGFMQRLALCGFGICLHGHIHKVDQNLYRYDMNPGGRKIEIVGAGTFGAPVKEWTPGYPLQYNFITLAGRTLTVNTRCRHELNGAWDADYQWRHGDGKQPWYEIALPGSTAACAPKEVDVLDDAPLEIPYLYKEWLIDQCKDMDFTRLIGTSAAIRAELPEVFIPLYANRPGDNREKARDVMGLGGLHENIADVEDLMAENDALVVEGQAGSGKTTLIRHFAYIMIQNACREDLKGALPVLIFLKDLKDFRPSGAVGNSKTTEEILTYYADLVETGLDAETVIRFADKGRAVFLLDGLDEISPELRGLTATAFAAFKRKNPKCNIILSGRPHGVDQTVVKCFGQNRAEILRLNMGQIEDFIRKWFAHVFERESKTVNKTAESMIGEVRAHPDIDRLVDTPLMLTAVCLLYLDDRELPGQRAELYHRFVDNLLHRRFPDPERVKNFLMALAHHMHTRRTRGVDREKALPILERECGPPKGDTPAACRQALEDRFDHLEPACALLKREKGQYSFRHLTFQEFLTAVFLVAEASGDHAEKVEKFWDDDWYAEVVELYVGYLSIHSRGTANDIVRGVLKGGDAQPFVRWRRAVKALLDIHKDRRVADVVEKGVERLWEVIGSSAAPKIRADAGELLGRLGDDRNFKAFVPVKGGKYILSGGEREVEFFEMGRYPVANVWFAEFIDAGGYRRSEYWTDEGKKWLLHTKAEYPRFWHEWKWNCPNHPVVGVCWYEADAFIKWLNVTAGDGFRYFLPDEHQWQAVAGVEKRKYPWGDAWEDGACNTKESEIEKTSAAGIFEKGDTPDGIADMAGNVWEWTRSDYYSKVVREDFYFDPEMQRLFDAFLKSTSQEEKDRINKEAQAKWEEKDRQFPVLLGGSWYHDQDACGARFRFNPIDRYDVLGFRCARTP